MRGNESVIFISVVIVIQKKLQDVTFSLLGVYLYTTHASKKHGNWIRFFGTKVSQFLASENQQNDH